MIMMNCHIILKWFVLTVTRKNVTVVTVDTCDTNVDVVRHAC